MKTTFTLLAFLGFISASFGQEDPDAIINLSKSIWCENKAVIFNNGSINAQAYLWRFGDGTTSTDKSPRHKYDVNVRTDSFMVTMIATDTINDVSDSMTRQVKIQKSATAKYSFKPIATICIFYNESEGFDGLTWDFGDKKTSFSIADSITHAYPPKVDSVYKVTLVATTDFQCNDTMEQTVSIVDSAEGGSSIIEHNKYGLKMFPNPSNNQILQFELSAPEKLHVSVSDANGRVIHTLNNSYQAGIHQIPVGSYLTEQASGLYFVSLNNERETYVLKAYKP